MKYVQSPEVLEESSAARNAAELGLLQHALKGFRDVQNPGVYPEGHHAAGKAKDRFYYKDGSYREKPMELASDDASGLLDEREMLELQLMEVKNALANEEVPEKFAQFTPEQRALLTEIYNRQVGQSSRSNIGLLGLNGRVYPKDHPLAGQEIPYEMSPEYKNARSVKLALDQIGGVDPDTGIGLYGGSTDAMHRLPAAEYPERMALIENIKQGLASLNQSDGKRTGEALRSSRQSRKLNLDDQLFFMENQTPVKQRGTPIPEGATVQLATLLKEQGSQDRADRKIVNSMSESERSEELAQHMLRNKIDELLGDYVGRDSVRGTGERDLVINSEGGDVTIGDNALRKNGNGKKH